MINKLLTKLPTRLFLLIPMRFYYTVLLLMAVTITACAATPDQVQTTPTTPATTSPVAPSPAATINPNVANQTFSQEIQLAEKIESGRVGEVVTVPVTVRNTSNFIWDSSGTNPVNFSYNWFDANGNRVVRDGERTALNQRLEPQQSEKLNATIKFPDQPGNYTLALTMVQEGVTWFNDAGAQSPRATVNVTAQ